MSPAREKWNVAAICVVLTSIIFIVFGQAMGFDFVNYDDNVYVTNNGLVAGGLSLKGVAWVFTHADCNLYHPLTMLSLMADYQFHGLHPAWFHFTNILLHTASAILLFLLLRQMTGAFWRSACVAAVFAIHPLRVESVAWVAERKDVLGCFFFMLTLVAYVRYVQKQKSPGRYLMMVAAFLMALLSKPTVVTAPFLLLLLDFWPLKRWEQERLGRLVAEKIPLLVLAVGACVLTVVAARTGISAQTPLPLSARLSNALVSYVIYLRQMVWPDGLAAYYPRPPGGYSSEEILLSIALLVLVTASALVFGRKRPWLLTGWFWYLGMALPMIGLVSVGAFAHADRMTYLPAIGIYLAVTWLVSEWGLSRAAVGGLMACVIAVLMICAWNQARYWKNSETLWVHTIDCTGDNDIAQNDLGNYLFQKGRLNDAIPHLQAALKITPAYPEAHYNLGNAYRQQGRVEAAVAEYRAALQSDPASWQIENNLATAMRQINRLDDAILHFQKALQMAPEIESIHFNFARALLQKGATKKAIGEFQKCLELMPDDVEAENNLAWLLATCENKSLRNGPLALQLAQRANKLAGGKNPLILGTLAAAFAETGRLPEAIQSAEQALKLVSAQPDGKLAARLQSELKRYRAGHAL